MKFRLCALALLCVSSLSFAEDRGKIVIIGTGKSSAEPEYFSLQINVTSLCYDTSLEAKDANAALANDLIAILQRYATDPRSKVSAVGGINVRQSESVSDGERMKLICQQKWRATNLLSLESPTISDLPALQDELLTEVDRMGSVQPDATKVAQTYADLGQPGFNAYEDTLKRLRAEAQKASLEDARAQVKTFTEQCLFSDVKLQAIAPPHVESRATAYSKMVGSMTTYIPESIEVTSTWQFEWSFDASTGCLEFLHAARFL